MRHECTAPITQWEVSGRRRTLDKLERQAATIARRRTVPEDVPTETLLANLEAAWQRLSQFGGQRLAPPRLRYGVAPP